MVKSDPEFTAVPKKERLEIDDDSDPAANALDEATGADDEDLDDYRNLDGPVWGGPGS